MQNYPYDLQKRLEPNNSGHKPNNSAQPHLMDVDPTVVQGMSLGNMKPQVCILFWSFGGNLRSKTIGVADAKTLRVPQPSPFRIIIA